MPERDRSVDVILPTWRSGPWVDEAIASVLAQTHRALRITVVDDASPDGSAEAVAKRWGDAGGRLAVLRLGERGGAAAARNEAVRRTQAPLLAFIDQDDRWRPAKLERQVARLEADPGLAAVHTDIVHIDAAGRVRPGEADADNARRAGVAWDRLGPSELLRECFGRIGIRLATALVRRPAFEAVGGFDARHLGGEEWEFWVRLAAAGHRVGHVPEPLVERRIHPGNTSSVAVAERREGHFEAIAAVVARHPELAPLADGLRASVLRTEILTQLRAGRGREARRAARLRLAIAPPGAELRLLWLLSFAGPLLRSLFPTLEALAARAASGRKR
jgi:glycosyltransferase involved in cell wall biosynthesis